ncbi:hypothetical protein ACMFMF_011918 [Clarireedia jacksonii]
MKLDEVAFGGGVRYCGKKEGGKNQRKRELEKERGGARGRGYRTGTSCCYRFWTRKVSGSHSGRILLYVGPDGVVSILTPSYCEIYETSWIDAIIRTFNPSMHHSSALPLLTSPTLTRFPKLRWTKISDRLTFVRVSVSDTRESEHPIHKTFSCVAFAVEGSARDR